MVVWALVVGAVSLIRRRRGADPARLPEPTDPARETLRRRFAEGEIDEQDYEQRLAALTWR